jgi:uncharacterized membrane protein YfcA
MSAPISPLHLAVVVAISFAAGLIDAMAGGGGTLTLPSIASFGFPIPVVGGTNKVVGTSGSSTATIRFLLRGKIDLKSGGLGALFAAIGAVFGARTLSQLGKIDEHLARAIFGVLLIAMALYLFFRPTLGGENRYAGPTGKNLALGAAIGLVIGFYDGFFGPGTGSFLVFAMVRILKFDFTTATGNAKLMNFGSNIASLITFIAAGLVVWRVALPMGAANALGSFVGAQLAITRGAKFVRWVFLLVAIAIAGRMLVFAISGR